MWGVRADARGRTKRRIVVAVEGYMINRDIYQRYWTNECLDKIAWIGATRALGWDKMMR